jgi:hypothetical protein
LPILVSLYLFRDPILDAVGDFLVVDESLVETDFVLVVDGDRRYDQAASLFNAGLILLLIEARPERLQREGLAPTSEEEALRELKSRGVPESFVTIIPGKAFTDWDRARCLSTWLDRFPKVQVAVLCDRLGSRRLRHILDRTLGAEKSRRVHLHPLAHRWYDFGDWWRRREGVLAVGQAYLRLGFVWLCGEGAQDSWQEWDPEAYERSLH